MINQIIKTLSEKKEKLSYLVFFPLCIFRFLDKKYIFFSLLTFIFPHERTYMLSVLHNPSVVLEYTFSKTFISKDFPTSKSHFFKIYY